MLEKWKLFGTKNRYERACAGTSWVDSMFRANAGPAEYVEYIVRGLSNRLFGRHKGLKCHTRFGGFTITCRGVRVLSGRLGWVERCRAIAGHELERRIAEKLVKMGFSYNCSGQVYLDRLLAGQSPVIPAGSSHMASPGESSREDMD